MNTLNDLYNFIDFAKGNRKYPENTANNLKSALKIFEKNLNKDELDSINLIEDSIDEIFMAVVNSNKDKNIGSLNTYKARLLKVINDYKKYGADPSKIQGWVVKTKNSTPLLIRKDKIDKNKISLSDLINTPVDNADKIEIIVQANSRIKILLSKNPSEKEIILRIL